ncbi:heavy-metal-associated domain-containing protein [Spongiivirga sp. MCCC 1A20706]|uniref:heavy metal translocating P-type ATPase n=1 Tax=Spongiivirga sp. MCCC 1A20706 TaxID=3160963 RepID=UPI003977B34D
MKKIFEVKGMTCKGCEASVAEKLNAVDGVLNVEVSLEKNAAVLITDKQLNLDTLQRALPDKFKISTTANHSIFNTESSIVLSTNRESKLKQLRPLLLIFLYLITASVLLHIKNWNATEAMLDFMGLFYIVFSFFKLLDLKGFPASFAMYDPIAKKINTYGWIYPFIEVALGLMFLLRFELFYALVATLIILGATTIGVTQALLSKKTIQCACLGTALKLPMTQATFIENSIMIIMAVFMLINML